MKIALISLALLALACVGGSPQGRHEASPQNRHLSGLPGAEDGQLTQAELDLLTWEADFREAQERYTQAIRWLLVDDAVEYVDPALQGDFHAMAHDLREVRFTNVVIESVEIEPQASEASATVRYSGYWLASPFVRDLRVQQEWSRDPQTRRWTVRPEIARLQDAARGVVSGAPPASAP